VVGGDVLNRVKREGELSGRGKCPGEYVQGEMSGSHSVMCLILIQELIIRLDSGTLRAVDVLGLLDFSNNINNAY